VPLIQKFEAMAVSSKDIETLWKRYSEEGANQKISVVKFFESNGVPYHAFEKWYKKQFSMPEVADCIVKGTPDIAIGSPNDDKAEITKSEKKNDVSISYINIGLSNGIKIEHHRLSYGELVCFITKLQSLCSA